jgi:DNA-binding CsgD family transcriptional regulator
MLNPEVTSYKASRSEAVYERAGKTIYGMVCGVIKLSAREQEVLTLYVQKGRLKLVADELGVSIGTIRSQKGNIMRKLGASNSVQLTAAAIRRGLVDLK